MYVSLLVDDLMKVIHFLKNNNLIKNVSRYTYYVIRLASQRSILLLIKPKDLKDGPIKNWFDGNWFDGNLFNIIYPELGWDINCNCPYYRE